MNDTESKEINRIKEEIEKKYMNIEAYIDTDTWKEWFKDEKHKPICGVQFMNFLFLKPEKVGEVLDEATQDMVGFFKNQLKASFPKHVLESAISNIFSHWVRKKIIVMYNSSNLFFIYLFVLVRDEILIILPEEAGQSYEEIVDPRSDQSHEKISPSEIPLASSLSGKPSFIYLRGEDEAIDLIDKVRSLESIDNPKKVKVLKLYLENEEYSVRDIAEKTKVSKSDVQRIIKDYKK